MNFPSQVKTRSVVILLACMLFVSSVSIYYGLSASTPTSGLTDIYIEPPMMESSYIVGIYTSPSTCYYKNGTTGEIVGTGSFFYCLQNAITALTSGGKVYVRGGDYTLTSQIVIAGNNIFVEGEEGMSTSIQWNTTSAAFVFGSGSWHYFCGLKNLIIHGSAISAIDGIYIQGPFSDVWIDNCYISSMNTGITLKCGVAADAKIWNVWIQNCLIEDNLKYGIYLTTTYDGTTRMIDRVKISECHFYGNKNSVHCDTPYVWHVTFTDNTVQAETQSCVNVTSGGRQWIISDNHIFDCGIGANGTYAGIFVNGTGTFYPDSWLIENNIIANHFTSAPVAMKNSIWLTGTVTNFVIQGNFFFQAAQPIRLDGLASFETLKIQGNLDYGRNLVYPTENNRVYTYIVDKFGSTYYMLNCSTNNVDYTSSSSTVVYTYALGNCSEKQKILAKTNTYYGSYYFASDSILTVCTAGETISASNLTYFNGTTYRWYLADADAETTIGNGTVAITMSTATAGNLFLRLTEGFIYYSGWTWTAESKIYVSTTAGALTETMPSGVADQILRVGYAFNSTTIEFKISDVYLEHV